MNHEHHERLASEEWRTSLRDHILPFALGSLTLDALGDDVLEVGPGPGLTTDILLANLPRVTAVEIDPELADALAARLGRSNLEVVNADATAMPLPDARFSGAVSFAMLHHVPTAEHQDALFAEIHRVLRPGALLIAMDGVVRGDFEAMHVDDVYNPVEVSSLDARLRAAGFTDVDVRANSRMWACHARRPA